jgi:uncharacterized protein YjdB
MKKKIKLLGSTFLVLAVALFGFNVGAVSAATTYTLADVAMHNSSTDCWVAIQGNVYNLTAFIPLHPGGAGTITGLCGTDGTAAINSSPHGASVLEEVAQYIIGALVAASSPVLTSVMITPATSSIAIAGTETLTASPMDQNSTAFIGATTTFTSSAPTIATVDSATGMVTGVAAGTATITATSVSGTTTVTGTAMVTVTGTTTLLGILAAEDFGVVSYDTGLGMLKGYTAGFGLTDATFANVQSVVVKLYSGTTLLQTNTATTKVGATLTGAQISSPFDVSGNFDYTTDGYWTNVRETQYGQSMPATRVTATVTLANGKVVTAENTNLTGDTTTIYPIIGTLTSVTIIPTITVGGMETLSVVPKDQNGIVLTGATTTFTSSDPTVATVNSTTGTVTGVKVGTVTITATSVSGTTTVTGTTMIMVVARHNHGGNNGGGGENEGTGNGSGNDD